MKDRIPFREKPPMGSMVIVMEPCQSHWKGMVFDLLDDDPERIRVTAVDGSDKSKDVAFRHCAKGRALRG